MRARDRRRREETAYHEAGHAVASRLLRRRFRSVSIEPEDDSLGRVSQTWSERVGWLLGGGDTDALVRQGVILEAGAAAADIHTGRRTRGGGAIDIHGSDQYGIGDLALACSEDGWEQVTFARWVRLRARLLLREPRHWAMVEGLARALLERDRLTYREARAAMDAGIAAWRAVSLRQAGPYRHR